MNLKFLGDTQTACIGGRDRDFLQLLQLAGATNNAPIIVDAQSFRQTRRTECQRIIGIHIVKSVGHIQIDAASNAQGLICNRFHRNRCFIDITHVDLDGLQHKMILGIFDLDQQIERFLCGSFKIWRC